MTLGLTGIALMSGLWEGYCSTPQPITDINGRELTVGDTVKLICRVIAVDPLATHFDTVTLRPILAEGDPELSGSAAVIKVDPKQLLCDEVE